MSRGKSSLVRQVSQKLGAKTRFGHSKAEDKRAFLNGEKSKNPQDFIYSYDTLKTYTTQGARFVRWVKSIHPEVKTLAQARVFVGDYYADRSEGWSSSTRVTVVSSLAKLYDTTAPELRQEAKIPETTRHFYEVTRSRADETTAHYRPENHPELDDFCRSSGLRRHEVAAVRGSDFYERDGKYFIHVAQGKGGRPREVPLIGDADRLERVRVLCENAGERRVFGSVCSGADIHGYRRDYATDYYNSLARTFEECKNDHDFYNPEHRNADKTRGGFDRNAVYFYRDGSGDWLDKRAMLAVSEALGHSRISVVGEHYIKR